MTDVMTLRQAIEFAVKTEELGAEFYRRLATKFSDQPELKEMFELLTNDEVMHRDQFRKLLEETPPDEGVSTGPEFQYLRAMSLSQFFWGEKGLNKKCNEIKNKTDAMATVFELENQPALSKVLQPAAVGIESDHRMIFHDRHVLPKGRGTDVLE